MYRSYNIAAVQTKYNGNVFSSRLEDRWAVYLDCLGVGYDYEPCYFELLSRNYLPDFWIYDDYSEEYFWLEIKPNHPKEFEIDLMYELYLETENCGTILYGNIPDPQVPEDCPEDCVEYWYKDYLNQTVGPTYVGAWWDEEN